MPSTMQITCPLCNSDLYRQDNSWHCNNSHCFDIAKQGYCNLLPVQNKRSKEPGDDADMVAARHRFLQQGYYQGIADTINQLVKAHCQQQHIEAPNIIDAGCGEGYYSSRLHQQFDNANSIGIDISKFAVRTAARTNKAYSKKNSQWFVASSSSIPVRDHCADIILSLFSPLPSAEFKRCLQANGLLLVASTGPQHLIELRQHLYEEVNEKAFDPEQGLSEHFHRTHTTQFSDTIELPEIQTILDLLAMTPHYWRASPEKKEQLKKIDTLQVSLDIQLHCFSVNTSR